ncbi:hypothetical protein CONPUDRAFT_136908 [Coniophora puteana RWD-64-598 SS2]|uniref:Uncharacterized protein n=1 Tax=Coniophora puteana (strain RWD-64-598) TaxID=741705 RepID=A0A5M3MUY4_CONPW|nr:uncharacterized protein CONPUDRAFT_136908 [Coniophora puteana RWD-64-598 SS2]EIW82411.1 hypothetical protein CONPUDRAFT_136908 [Coniophora puteana RWD-64-598 SS2]
MCYIHGNTDPRSHVCPMCKVFKPSGARCPHVRDVCYNRALHPQHDIVYIKNAEVKAFNGCGYCKWAKVNPPTKLSGNPNPGWPGCCRPPSASEQRFVGPADWPTVSIVHGVPIPPEIKSVLDSLAAKGSSIPGLTTIRLPAQQPSIPPLDRRNSGSNVNGKPASPSAKYQTLAASARGRSDGSPTQQTYSLANSSPRASSTNIVLNDTPRRQQTYPEGGGERSRSSTIRRSTEMDGSVSRRPSGRSSASSVLPPSVMKKSGNELQSTQRSSPSNDSVSQITTSVRKMGLAPSSADHDSHSESSSDSGSSNGSSSDTTVVSDGAFTDYLSDESDAELQRQAEAKARLAAHNQAEELEFRAARQQLAGVGLRPPQAWDDTNSNRAMNHYAPFSNSSYNSAPVAHQARG